MVIAMTTAKMPLCMGRCRKGDSINSLLQGGLLKGVATTNSSVI